MLSQKIELMERMVLFNLIVLFPVQESFFHAGPQWDFACVPCTWLLTNRLKLRIF